MSHFPADTIARLDELISRYPTKKAALLPALWVAQEVGGGLLTDAAMAAVAKHLDLPPAEVQGVATFYTMETNTRERLTSVTAENFLLPKDRRIAC